MNCYLGKYAVIPLNFSRGTNIEAERGREISYKKEKEVEVFVVRSISSHRVKVERAVSSTFARPRCCPFSSSIPLSSSSSSYFPTSHRSSTPTPTATATATATAVPTTIRTGSTSFQSASNYNPHHTIPTSSRPYSHSDTPTPTPTPTLTPTPTTSGVNIPSLALVKCIQSCLSNSKSDDSPSNRTLSKSTLLYWNVENNNCHFENKKQKLAYNNVQIYPKIMISDENVYIVKKEIIDLCSDASAGVGTKHSNSCIDYGSSHRDISRNQNGNKFNDYEPVFLDLSSSSSSSHSTSYPTSSSSSSSSTSSSSFTNRPSSKISPFEIMSLQQSENILLLVASNKSPMCLDINITLATANYNYTCPFSKKVYQNISQDMQATLSPPIPQPISVPVPAPPTTTSSSTFNAPLKIKKKPCDEYTVMFRLPPCSSRLIGIFIAVPLGQSMSPLNSDYLNDVTAEGQGQGQGWGQGQEGSEGGRSSRIRILSAHCMDADRTADPPTFHETGLGRRCGAESGRRTDTVADCSQNTYTDCVNAVLSVGDSGSGNSTTAGAGASAGTGTGAGARNRVRDGRITDSSFSCPDHFKPFYSPCL